MKDAAILSEQSQEIKSTIGNEAFTKLIDAFEGDQVYIPTRKTVEFKDEKQKAIQLLVAGTNRKEVVKLCEISEYTAYILGRNLKEQPEIFPLNECFLSNQIQEIKELVGEEAFFKLVDTFGGTYISIPMKNTIEYAIEKEKAIKLLKSGFHPNEILKLCKSISKSSLYRLSKSLSK